MSNTFTIRKALTSQDIADLVTAAVEGGIGYWAIAFKLMSEHEGLTSQPWYADPKLYEQDFLIRVTEDEESKTNAGVDHDLTPSKMQSALDFLVEKYPHISSSISEESYDASDADCFIQAAIFGEIVYG